MRNKCRAVHFEHKYIVDNPYLATLHELHLALVAQCIYGEADAGAGIYMSRLGKETYVKRHSRHVSRCLRRIEPSDTLPCARVVPLPLFHILAKLSVGMRYSHA